MLRLFDRSDGSLLWSFELDFTILELFVDDDARVVASVAAYVDVPSPWIINTGGISVIDGELISFPNYYPLGPITESGWVPVSQDDGDLSPIGVGFWQPLLAEYVEVSSTTTSGSVHGDTLEYVDNDAPTPELVIRNRRRQAQHRTPVLGGARHHPGIRIGRGLPLVRTRLRRRATAAGARPRPERDGAAVRDRPTTRVRAFRRLLAHREHRQRRTDPHQAAKRRRRAALRLGSHPR